MAITASQVNKIMREANEALRVVAQRNGVEFKPCRGSMDPSSNSFNIRFEGHATDGLSPEAMEYEKVKALHNLPSLGTTFRAFNTEYRIIGWRKWAPKYPVICEQVRTGKVQYLMLRTIYSSLGIQAPTVRGTLTQVPVPPRSNPTPGKFDELIADPIR